MWTNSGVEVNFSRRGRSQKGPKKFLRGAEGAENFQVFSTKNTIFTPFGAEGAENFAKYKREYSILFTLALQAPKILEIFAQSAHP